MKIKRIIAAAVFVCLLGGMMTSVGHFWRPAEMDTDNLNYLYKEDKDTLNVVCMGSSAMYRFWIPQQAYQEQGFTSALVATADQNIHAIPYLMDEVEKTQDVDLYVVEVRYPEAAQARVINKKNDPKNDLAMFSYIATGMRPSLNRLAMINDLLEEDEENTKLEWMLPILKYHGNAVTFKSDKVVERLNGIVDTDMYVRQTYKVTPMEATAVKENETIRLEEEYKNSIDRIAAKAEELGKRVFFLSTPYFPGEVRGNLHVQMSEYIKQQGYDYLDMMDLMDEIGLDARTDYYDEQHTNIAGSQKVTTYLASYLAKNYELPDRLDEVQKEHWRAACEEWNKNADELMEKWKEEVAKGVTDEKE